MTGQLRQDRTELAENRTDLAEDRTLLANERTFSGWARTAMASIGVGLGFNALFKAVHPTWFAKGIASVFILLGIFLIVAAERRAQRPHATDGARGERAVGDDLSGHGGCDHHGGDQPSGRDLMAGVMALPSAHAAAAIALTMAMFYGFAASRLKVEII